MQYADFPDGIDARTEHGELVLIRSLDSDSLELALLLRFSTMEMRAAPNNHCVPVLDHFQHPDDPSVTFIVNPYFRPAIEFDRADDYMEYVQQALEVCVFSLMIFGVSIIPLDDEKSDCHADSSGCFVLPCPRRCQCVSTPSRSSPCFLSY